MDFELFALITFEPMCILEQDKLAFIKSRTRLLFSYEDGK